MITFSKQFKINFVYLDKNLVGKTYKINITAELTVDYSNCDFDDLKQFVKDNIITKINNSFVYNKNTNNDTEKQLVNDFTSKNLKTFALNGEVNMKSVAENIFKSLNFCCVMENKDYRIKALNIFEKRDESITITENEI